MQEGMIQQLHSEIENLKRLLQTQQEVSKSTTVKLKSAEKIE